MFNKFFLMGMLIVTSQLLSAQPITRLAKVSWGKEMRASKRSTLEDVIGHDQTGVYAVRYISKGLYGLLSDLQLEHYDHQMNLTHAAEIDMKFEDEKRMLEEIIHLNDHLYLLSSYKDQKVKKNILYVQEIDKQSLQPATASVKLAEVDYEGYRKGNSGGFRFSISRDSSHFLVYYDMPYEKKESERFGFHILDSQLHSVWTKEVNLPYQEELFDIERFRVDNQGNVHVLGQIFHEKRRVKRHGEVNYKYQILSYRDHGNSMTEYPVELEGLYISDMQIAVRDNQDLVCAGFYSEASGSSIKGSYFLTIDGKTKSIKQKSHKAFGADFITQNMSERSASKTQKKIAKGKNVELYQYDLKNIVLRSDGGAVLTGEQFYVKALTFTSGNTTVTNYHYYYNDIIVVSIDPLGAIDWAQKIPKKQVSANDGGFFSSYAMSVVRDKIYFIFNDNPKNMIKKPGKTYPVNFGKKSAIVAMVEIDSRGNQKKEALFMRYDSKVLTRPKVCEQIAENEMVIFGQYKKSQKLGKIRFKPAVGPSQITSNDEGDLR